MADMNDVVKVAVDSYTGRLQKYSSEQSNQLIRDALIQANNGSTILDYRAIRDGKCQGLFTLVEEILSKTVVEGLTQDDLFYKLTEFRNVPEGDQPVFVVEDSSLFEVAEVARGTQGIRRQRIGGRTEFTLKGKIYAVRIYEELSRILSGRVDFGVMISKVAESFQRKLLDDLYAIWHNATADQMGGETYYPTAGTFSIDKLLEMIEHVEASASGRPATLLTTRKGARKLAPGVDSTEAGNDLYRTGRYATFYGVPIVITPQRHKVNSNEFVFDDNVIYVIAGDERPIKLVRFGNPLLIQGDPYTNGDLTQEYFYEESYGAGIVFAGDNASIGKYQFTD